MNTNHLAAESYRQKICVHFFIKAFDKNICVRHNVRMGG